MEKENSEKKETEKGTGVKKMIKRERRARGRLGREKKRKEIEIDGKMKTMTEREERI